MLNLAIYLSRFGSNLKIGTGVTNFRKIVAPALVDEKSRKDKSITVVEKTINNVHVRVYSPKLFDPSSKQPLMIYYHGGGYIINALDICDYYLIQFVKRLNIVVVSVDYRTAPENCWPTPSNDCFEATKYVLENPNEFNADVNRIVITGESAGGNAVAVVTQRLLNSNIKMPKLQVLIYPWTQMFYYKLPSCQKYGGGPVQCEQLALLYQGYAKTNKKLIKELRAHYHTTLIPAENLQRINSYLSVSKIPDMYKREKNYYKKSENLKKKNPLPVSLKENSVLSKDNKMVSLVEKFVYPEVSPLFADHENLVGLPRAYFILVEVDPIKDEGILYAERLKQAGVDTDIAFYDSKKAFHGVVINIHKRHDCHKIARQIQHDLIEYLKINL